MSIVNPETAELIKLGTRDKQIVKSLVLEPGFVICQLGHKSSSLSGAYFSSVNEQNGELVYEKFLGPGTQLAYINFNYCLCYSKHGDPVRFRGFWSQFSQVVPG